MAQTKCITGNVIKKVAATIVAAGNVSNTTVNNDLSLAELNTYKKEIGSHVYKAVSAASSGNIGTALVMPGTFSSQVKNQYIMYGASPYLNGSANTLFQSASNKMPQRHMNKLDTVHTIYLTALSWAATGGWPDYTFTNSAQAPSFGADHSTTIGEYCFQTGKPLPLQGDYTAPYSN